MKVLELFSGTHSIGKVAKSRNHQIVSLDRDMGNQDKEYISSHHIQEDILTWDYKQFQAGSFDLITASPVCLWWSILRNSWVGRKCKSIHPTDVITLEHIHEQINLYGKPMVDKVIEIIEYFKPKYYWIENPSRGRMKDYIKSKYPQYNIYYEVDYCKYSNFGYKKPTRFWTNIKNFKPKKCKNDCENIVEFNGTKKHREQMGVSKTVMDDGKVIRVNTKELRTKYKDFDNINIARSKQTERYRIPENLINEFFIIIESHISACNT